MTIFTKRDKRTTLEKEIDELIEYLREEDVFEEDDEGKIVLSPIYSKRLDIIERLSKLKDDKSHRCISADTIAIIAANLLGIGLILGFEKVNVITTKALGFVMRGRV